MYPSILNCHPAPGICMYLSNTVRTIPVLQSHCACTSNIVVVLCPQKLNPKKKCCPAFPACCDFDPPPTSLQA